MNLSGHVQAHSNGLHDVAIRFKNFLCLVDQYNLNHYFIAAFIGYLLRFRVDTKCQRFLFSLKKFPFRIEESSIIGLFSCYGEFCRATKD